MPPSASGGNSLRLEKPNELIIYSQLLNKVAIGCWKHPDADLWSKAGVTLVLFFTYLFYIQNANKENEERYNTATMVYAVFLSTGQELRANRGRLALILEVEALTGDFHNSGIVLLLESKVNFGDFQTVFAVLDHSDGGSVADLRKNENFVLSGKDGQWKLLTLKRYLAQSPKSVAFFRSVLPFWYSLLLTESGLALQQRSSTSEQILYSTLLLEPSSLPLSVVTFIEWMRPK